MPSKAELNQLSTEASDRTISTGGDRGVGRGGKKNAGWLHTKTLNH